jgi:tetratricopeptide (TPR) repeat protein
MYAESHSNDLFSDTKEVTEEKNFGEVSYYAALAAFMNKSYKKADKYAGYVIESGDTVFKADALKIQINSYKARKDSGEIDGEYLIKKVKQVYKANPENSFVFSNYIMALRNNGKAEEADKVLAKRLQENPNDLTANAYVADDAMNAGEYDKAIEAYNKMLIVQPDRIDVKYYIAICQYKKAVNLKNDNQPYKELLQKAKAIFQEVQTADPDEKDYKTKYILSTIDEI